jgi:hypothetical protein
MTLILAELVGATRFGCKPPAPNTFVNFQQTDNRLPGFISERERLNGRLDVRSL